ncbi:MAG: hypothetical protein ABI439_02155 [Rhodospirillales bacterium]
MGDRYRRRDFHANVDALLRRTLDTAGGRALLGHNGGPPLDWSGEMFLWRRAVAKAWKTPPREIALLRLNRAEQLGLSYRSFNSVLLDRGRWLNTIVFSLSALATIADFNSRDALPSFASAVIERFAALRNADILVLADPLRDRRLLGNRSTDELRAALNAKLGDKITGLQIVTQSFDVPDARQVALADFLQRNGRVAADTFMVGNTLDDLALAGQAGLSLFLWADEYFVPTP